MKWLTILALGAVLPIWRDPGWQGGVSAYEAVYNVSTKPQKEHITVEEALRLCRQAFQESLTR